jgi:hypothetical protein
VPASSKFTDATRTTILEALRIGAENLGGWAHGKASGDLRGELASRCRPLATRAGPGGKAHPSHQFHHPFTVWVRTSTNGRFPESECTSSTMDIAAHRGSPTPRISQTFELPAIMTSMDSNGFLNRVSQVRFLPGALLL